jgi:Calcineurin-like phosphoesterase
MPVKHNARLTQPVFHEPIFSEDQPLPSPTGFATRHLSDTRTYDEVEKLLKKDVVGVPKSRIPDTDVFRLQDAYGNHGLKVVGKIQSAKKIIFHALGDSGASNVRKYSNELRVSDQVTVDCNRSDEANQPAFLFHLGDVVYNFGESQYYYDQFYEPFRNYPAPIFAIPGNHDSFVVPGTPSHKRPLTTFQRNFCAEKPVITPEAGSLHRTAMTQPGVYFALDAPFVRLIGLFSNALEDPGVISNNDGKWPTVTDKQLKFLSAQLKRIKKEKYKGRGPDRYPSSALQLLAATETGRERRQSRLQRRNAQTDRRCWPARERLSARLPVGACPQLSALHTHHQIWKQRD